MSKQGTYNDTPFQIEFEGQTIDLNFNKITPDTAELTWNIPTPVVGCGSDQGAYNGIIVTVSDKSVVNSQRPADATYYVADPTVDVNLHAGDKIGTAMVVGAFYDDDTTSSLKVSDLEPNTPYYFSAYAVDKQGRYHKDGVHAYALDWAHDKKDRDLPAYQEVRVLGPATKRVNMATTTEPENSTLHGQWTGLSATEKYTISVHSDTLPTTPLVIDGAAAQTYGDLVKHFNEQLALAIAPTLNAGPPNIGSVYVDIANQRLYVWDGSSYTATPVWFTSDFPNNVNDGYLWLDKAANVLYERSGSDWKSKSFYTYHKPFNNVAAGDFWIDGQSAREWEGTTWCARNLITSPVDPSLSKDPDLGAFWYNPSTGMMYVWDASGCWKAVSVIYHDSDPSSAGDGSMWYDITNHVLYIRVDSKWQQSTASTAALPPKTPADGTLWVDLKNDVVKRYDFTTKAWVAADVMYWATDPLNRKSCDKWWKSEDGVDVIYVWDFINSKWVAAKSFTQSTTDPRESSLAVNQLWNRGDGHYFSWDGMAWTAITAIEIPHDPRTPVDGEILQVGDQWLRWNATAWEPLVVDAHAVKPSDIAAGAYWYDVAARQLKLFNGLTWNAVPFSVRPQIPVNGTRYFDTIENKLKEWKSGKWQDATLPLRATINELNNLLFVGETTGSSGCVEVDFSIEYRNAAKPWFFIEKPYPGHDAVSDLPTWKQVGVGTDGSAAERREIINTVLLELGSGSVAIELTKAALERCVDAALQTIRQKSSASVKRGFMFMDIQPNVQTYILSSKRSEYDKIVNVNGVFRVRGGRIGANNYNDPFESSMIQQLYFAGSFDLLSYHLLSSYNALLNEIFANNLMFTWHEYPRTLMLHQVMRSNERVLLDVMVERTEQDMFTDRYTRPWIVKYATAKAMMILAEIRGKYGSLPGAGGGVTLNASDLRSQATEYFEQCADDIDNFVVNSVEEVGLNSTMLLG